MSRVSPQPSPMVQAALNHPALRQLAEQFELGPVTMFAGVSKALRHDPALMVHLLIAHIRGPWGYGDAQVIEANRSAVAVGRGTVISRHTFAPFRDLAIVTRAAPARTRLEIVPYDAELLVAGGLVSFPRRIGG